MKTAFFEVEDWQKEYLKKHLKEKDMKFFNDELNERNVSRVKNVEVLSVFIYSEINKKILDEMPNLKIIATMSTGYDHIDIKECNKRGIKVYNVPYYGENTVAEHAVGLMLVIARNLIQAVKRTRKDDFDIEGLEGFDLKGKTLGVIGTGHIGCHVIKIAKAFEMKVIAFNRTKHKDIAKKLGFNYVSLDYLLKNSDIITLHCSLNPSSRHLLNMKNIKKIKKGAYLINTARGGLLETKALVYALDKKIIAGVGLDVLEEEEELKEERHLSSKKLTKSEKNIIKQDNKMLKEKNVIITPHIAYYTKEALQRILDVTIKNITSKNGNLVVSSKG